MRSGVVYEEAVMFLERGRVSMRENKELRGGGEGGVMEEKSQAAPLLGLIPPQLLLATGQLESLH